MATKLEGGCLCGGLRYRLHGEPERLCNCHCVDCRRSAGAAFVTWGTVPREKREIVRGELRRVPHAGRVRSFAACCGTHLFFEDAEDAPSVDVTIASLDDPAPFAPTRVIWTEDRLPWVGLDRSLPSYRQSSSNREE